MSIASFKIVILGNSGVGKTSILQRYVYDKFSDYYVMSIGVDWFYKSAFVTDKTRQSEVQLMLWDTSGQERFYSLALSYCKNASVAILVFDMQDPYSLEELRFWRYQAEQAQGNIQFVLAGNKCDRIAQIQPSAIDQQRIALGCAQYHEVSALNGAGVVTLFDGVAYLAFDTMYQRAAPQIVKEYPKAQTNNGGCC